MYKWFFLPFGHDKDIENIRCNIIAALINERTIYQLQNFLVE
jgi:hypothetical protein